MDGAVPPEAKVSFAPPEPPHSRFAAPDTVPEVPTTAVGQTVEPLGASAYCCRFTEAGHDGVLAAAADAAGAAAAQRLSGARQAIRVITAPRRRLRGRCAERGMGKLLGVEESGRAAAVAFGSHAVDKWA
jgi:hypothetical protein